MNDLFSTDGETDWGNGSRVVTDVPGLPISLGDSPYQKGPYTKTVTDIADMPIDVDNTPKEYPPLLVDKGDEDLSKTPRIAALTAKDELAREPEGASEETINFRRDMQNLLGAKSVEDTPMPDTQLPPRVSPKAEDKGTSPISHIRKGYDEIAGTTDRLNSIEDEYMARQQDILNMETMMAGINTATKAGRAQYQQASLLLSNIKDRTKQAYDIAVQSIGGKAYPTKDREARDVINRFLDQGMKPGDAYQSAGEHLLVTRALTDASMRVGADTGKAIEADLLARKAVIKGEDGIYRFGSGVTADTIEKIFESKLGRGMVKSSGTKGTATEGGSDMADLAKEKYASVKALEERNKQAGVSPSEKAANLAEIARINASAPEADALARVKALKPKMGLKDFDALQVRDHVYSIGDKGIYSPKEVLDPTKLAIRDGDEVRVVDLGKINQEVQSIYAYTTPDGVERLTTRGKEEGGIGKRKVTPIEALAIGQKSGEFKVSPSGIEYTGPLPHSGAMTRYLSNANEVLTNITGDRFRSPFAKKSDKANANLSMVEGNAMADFARSLSHQLQLRKDSVDWAEEKSKKGEDW